MLNLKSCFLKIKLNILYLITTIINQKHMYLAKDLYIEKDSSINDEIDELRHAAVAAIIERRDTIIVSSVSCIYSIGEKEEYVNKMLNLSVGDTIDRDVILEKLVGMQYERNELLILKGEHSE